MVYGGVVHRRSEEPHPPRKRSKNLLEGHGSSYGQQDRRTFDSIDRTRTTQSSVMSVCH